MPDPFTDLKLTVPPGFEAALGYAGDRRYVAFYWSPIGDELMYTDGETSADGEYSAWLLWSRHITVAPALTGFDFGSSEAPARHWLLFDRQDRRVYAGDAGQVEAFLAAQPDLLEARRAWEALSPEDQEQRLSEALAHLNQALAARPMPSGEDVERYLQESYRRGRKLAMWLDQQPVVCPACGQATFAALWQAERPPCPSCGAGYWEARVANRQR